MEIGKPVSQPYDSTIVKTGGLKSAVEAVSFDALTMHDTDNGDTVTLEARAAQLQFFGPSIAGTKVVATIGDLSSYVLTSAMQAYAQPIDSDLTAIAALSTTSYGRNLLTLANQAALQAAVVAAQTGTGSTFVMQASPTLTTPNIGVATADYVSAPNGYYVGASISSYTTLLGSNIRVASGSIYSWSSVSSNPAGANADLTLSRNAAGVIQIGTTAANALGSLACASIVTSSNIRAAGTLLTDSVLGHRTGCVMFGGTDGKMRFGNNAGTVGAYLDVTTADTVTIRNFADSAGGSLSCAGITLGSGTKILKVLSATATLDFGAVAANSFSDLTITVTGAALGDTVSIGVPNGSLLNDISFFGWVSATNTVAVRCSNVSSTTARDPASGTFRATVTQF